MADHFYGMNRGANPLLPSSIVIGTSTGATDVEVRIADAKSLTREDVYLILQRIADRIVVGRADVAVLSP